MTTDVIRQRIRQRLTGGRLPRNHAIELWRGPSVGQTCDACGDAIAPADFMCLLCSDDWRAIHLHECCLELWDDERRVDDHGRDALAVAAQVHIAPQ